MKHFYFVQIGKNTRNNTVIHNLISRLNSIQPEFLFKFDDDYIEHSSLDENGIVQSEPLEDALIDFANNKLKGYFPIAICDCQLEEDLFSTYGTSFALISTFYWSEMSFEHVQNCIALTLVDIILNIFIDTNTHYDPIGCPMDYCSKGEMKISLDKCEFCRDCEDVINKSIKNGKLTLQQKACLHKILDLVANRKHSFAIMPFHKNFDAVYLSAIEKAMQSANWNCNRADRLYESKEISTIVCEQILRADTIIADVTENNPNVMYELGYAHALSKRTILITQNRNSLPINLKHMQCIEYAPDEAGLTRLQDQLTRHFK